MRLIITKYLPATNFRGARVKAKTTYGKSVTVPYRCNLNNLGAHELAVKALLDKEGKPYLCAQTEELKTGYYFFIQDAE